MSVISMKRLLGAEAQGASHPLRVAQILVRGIGLLNYQMYQPDLNLRERQIG